VGKGNYKIPFDFDGNLVEYDGARVRHPTETNTVQYTSGPRQVAKYVDPQYKDNYIFEATLTFKSIHRGRSAAHFIVEDEHGHKYVMFMTDLLTVLENCKIDRGKVHEHWTFIKRGKNYGIQLA
jgi:hypothetical protein